MDLLTGYGSGSEDEERDSPVPSVKPGIQRIGANLVVDSAPVGGSDGAAAAAAARPHARGLFGSLPAPRGGGGSCTANNTSKSDLPAGFFEASNAEDSGAAKPAASAPAGHLPAGFFDAAPPAAAAAAAADDTEVMPGPAVLPARRQVAAPSDSDLPAPSSGAVALWDKLPAPQTAAATKRRVLLRARIDPALLAPGSDSDEDASAAAAKRAKTAASSGQQGSGVLSFLPAPKNAPRRGAGTSSAFGDASAGMQRQKQQQQQQQADAAQPSGEAVFGNEAYRVARPPAGAAAAAAGPQQYYAAASAVGYQAPVQQQQQPQQQQRQQQLRAVTAGLAPEEALLQEALAEEAARAARRTTGHGTSQLQLPELQFKEISADSIKHVDAAAQRDAAQGLRGALGSDYAATLRSQAAPHTGSRLARSKHQIGTLFANAKLRELEVLENRAAGMRTKSETSRKYGWR